MTDAVKMVTGVTRDDAVKFLEQACRNWRHVPHLSNEDIADVMVALAVFARKANPANPTCNDSLQVAAPVKQSLTTDQAGAMVAAPVVDHGITTSTVVDRAKGFYDTQAPLPTLQRLGQEFDAGEAVAWRVDDLTAKGEVCDSFVIFTDHENVEDHVRKYGQRHTKVTPLYAHPPQSRGQAFEGEGEELAEAVRCIMARCEALEEEAYNGIATTTANGRDETHEAGFWRGQKSTAKSIREHLHDMTRATLSEAREAGDSLSARDRV